MRTVITLMIISISLFSCNNKSYIASKDFYQQVLNERKIFKDFLKYKGNRLKLEKVNKDLLNSEKIIIVFLDRINVIYDVSNDKYFLIKEDNLENFIEFKIISNDEVPPTFLFVLEYVLNNKIDELEKISQEAFDANSSCCIHKIYVDIIDVNNSYYKRCPFDNFMVHNGKPVMTHKEFIEAHGIFREEN